MATEGDTGFSTEEEDLLERSKRKSKERDDMEASQQGENLSIATETKEVRRSYRDSVLGYGKRRNIRGEELDDGYMSDDDLIEESTDGTWVGWDDARGENQS